MRRTGFEAHAKRVQHRGSSKVAEVTRVDVRLEVGDADPRKQSPD